MPLLYCCYLYLVHKIINRCCPNSRYLIFVWHVFIKGLGTHWSPVAERKCVSTHTILFKADEFSFSFCLSRISFVADTYMEVALQFKRIYSINIISIGVLVFSFRPFTNVIFSASIQYYLVETQVWYNVKNFFAKSNHFFQPNFQLH